jgi:hypothetical protein
MKYKVKFFEITDDKKIVLHIKKPLFKTMKETLSYFHHKFNDGNESFLGSGIDANRDIILVFLLRNFERDIKPYIKYQRSDVK